MTDKPLGLYLHIPFCKSKCAYCSFYSKPPANDDFEAYIKALIKEISKWGGKLKNRPIDTIYLGGGTPSLLGERITDVLNAAKENFSVIKDAEITAEVNPESVLPFLECAKESGVNRISIGAQSGNDDLLKKLGRIHTVSDTKKAVEMARKSGFDNISLDLMLALPESDETSLKEDLDFILSLNPEHISAYILKKEKGTRLYKSGIKLPNDDGAAEQYLFACETLENAGYSHYEISNFAKRNFESRHNLKYWNCEEYLGIGPSAHSYLGGERFYYPDSINEFITCPETVFEGIGGEKGEKLMLALRLKAGVELSEFKKKSELINNLKTAGYIEINDGRLSLTDEGMLVSNAIITELIL